MNQNFLGENRLIFLDAPKNIDYSQVSEKLDQFNNKVDALDKAFDTKSKSALVAIENVKQEIEDYLMDKGVKIPKLEKGIIAISDPKLHEIISKYQSISSKIEELTASPDFGLDETYLVLPKDAESAGFRILDKSNLQVDPWGPLQFTPEEGFITKAVWKNNTLIIETSKGIRYAYQKKEGALFQDGQKILG